MLGSLLHPHIYTNNLVFLGFVNGLTAALIAMGIVLIYRSSRVINFAVSDLGVPAAAIFASVVGNNHWPYWIGLVAALLVGTASGTVVEIAVIRRLSKAPRVIVLVATIGVAEVAQAATHTLPDYRSGSSALTGYPSPMKSSWLIGNVGIGPFRVHNITVTGPQVLAIIVVPLIAFGLWWLLGRTTFGEAVRATATNADLARLTGVSPKLVATAIWTIAGFLSAVSVILYATVNPSSQLVTIGPQTLLIGLTAALIGGMTSFPRAFAGAIVIGVLNQILTYNYTDNSSVVQFVLFILVLVLVARMSRVDAAGGESFAFAPRVPPVPERLREIWWVRRMPQVLAGIALLAAIVLPLLVHESARHLTYSIIAGFAICAVSVTVLTGWGGQLSLGQMAFAGIGGLSAAAFSRGITLNIGWRSHRIFNGALQPFPFAMTIGLLVIAILVGNAAWGQRWRGTRLRVAIAAIVVVLALEGLFAGRVIQSTVRPLPFVLDIFCGALVACFVAVLVGAGALRVKGLLLAISTMAFAIAAQSYLFARPIFTGQEGSQTLSFPRGKLGPVDLTVFNRNYYFFVLACLVLVLAVAGHLRRTGVGRIIIGVRENEEGAAALTVSPTKAKLTAFALGGFLSGLGGALLGGAAVTIAFDERFYRVPDSFNVVAIAVIGGLGSLAGAVTGALWVIGLPAFWPNNATVLLLTSGIGLLIVLLYFPGGFTQLGYSLRGSILRWLEQRLPEREMKTRTAPPASLTRISTPGSLTLNSDGSAVATRALTVKYGGIVAVNAVDFHADPGEVIGLIGTNGAGKSTLLNAIGGFAPISGKVELLGRDVSKLRAHHRARLGLGRTFQAAKLFPELTVRETVQLALEARRATSFWGSVLWLPPAVRSERAKRAEAAELIDFLGLGRYADRFVAELSTGTRRIVELSAVLAVAPRVLCLDEPTAGVAQREAEAFGPLIKRVQQELDATLVVVEHDLPMILALSDRVYCMEAGAVIAEGTPSEVRNNPLVVSSYLGTDDRAIQRSDV
jgi:ABC-type branched-subunit amino acid transport system ATPase component/ABC-type branched-subunit amino acid transport system permease subunit